MNKFTAVPLNLREAQAYIDELHRHHKSSVRDKFRVGAADSTGKLVGVAQCGQPINRNLNDGKTLEVLRLCTDGTKDVCSFLYAKCARIAREMGYEKIITYILESESGTSLKASGWICEDSSCGGGYMGKLHPLKTKAGTAFNASAEAKIPGRDEKAKVVQVSQ